MCVHVHSGRKELHANNTIAGITVVVGCQRGEAEQGSTAAASCKLYKNTTNGGFLIKRWKSFQSLSAVFAPSCSERGQVWLSGVGCLCASGWAQTQWPHSGPAFCSLHCTQSPCRRRGSGGWGGGGGKLLITPGCVSCVQPQSSQDFELMWS